MNTIWGDYPGGSIPGLPAQRMGYNAATGRGLSNLSKSKKNLVNINWNGYSLCTDKVSYQAMIKKVCIACKGYDVILVIENEPQNKNVIGNTTVIRYKNCLLWAKEVADSFGVQVMHGGIMMPAAAAILAGTMDKAGARDFRNYMSANGFNVGSPSKAEEAIDQLLFCNANGILGNFHWQQESMYLTSAIIEMQRYCPDLSGNEFAVRNNNDGGIEGLVNAIAGLRYAILYNTTGSAKNAVPLTKDKEEVFVRLVS